MLKGILSNRRVRNALLFLALLYGAALLGVQRLVYRPWPNFSRTPDAYGWEWEDVRFRAKDGAMLHGWFIPGDSRRTVIFCHGNAGNISHGLRRADILKSLGVSVFLFDYRGFGISHGRPTESGIYADTEAAFDWLKENKGLSGGDTAVFGRSLGGAAALELAARRPVAGVLLESTFTSLADVARAFVPYLPAELFVFNAFDNMRKIERIDVPVLIMASIDDEITPFEHGRKLFDAAKEPKFFLTMNGLHRSSFYRTEQEYVDAVRDFLEFVFGAERSDLREN